MLSATGFLVVSSTTGSRVLALATGSLRENPARLLRVKLALPPREHVIEISSDSDVSKPAEGSVSSVRKQLRKKAINTLTSVISARSKLAARSD